MSVMPVLAFQNIDVLRALHLPDAASPRRSWEGVTAFAKELERDPSNTRKLLQGMEEVSLVTVYSWTPFEGATTPQGASAVAAYARMEGSTEAAAALPVGFIALRHDQIGRDPDNARKSSGLTPGAIRDMADSLIDKGMLQHPEVRLNPDRIVAGEPDYLLSFGERRWRGWGLNIERGEWPADKLFICKLEDRDELDRLEAGLVENEHREGINNVERAEQYLVLHDRFNRTPQQIAKVARRTPRFVQIAIKVAREADPEDKARYVESEKAYAEGKAANLPGIRRLYRWEDLRDSVKTARYVTMLEKRSRLTLLVAELARKVDTDPDALAVPTETGHQMVSLISTPPGGGHWGEAQDLGVVVDHREDGKIYGGVTLDAREWLDEAGFDKDPVAWIRALSNEVHSSAMPSKLAEERGIWITTFLNPPPPVAAPAPAPPPALADTSTSPPPARDSFAQQIRDVNAEVEAEVGPATAQGVTPPAAAPPPAAIGPNLTGEQFLILVEVAHKISTKPVQTRGGAITGCDVIGFHTGPHAKAANELLLARMLSFPQSSNGNGFLAALTQAAWDYLGGAVDDERLEGFRHDNMDFDDLTAFEAAGEKYQTTWLRDPVKVSEPKAAAPAVAADDLDDPPPFEVDDDDVHGRQVQPDHAPQLTDTTAALEAADFRIAVEDIQGFIGHCSRYLVAFARERDAVETHVAAGTLQCAEDLIALLRGSDRYETIDLYQGEPTPRLVKSWTRQ